MPVDELEVAITERAWRDPSFKRALVADPRTTLKREFGTSLPDGVQLTVLESSPTQQYLVLPSYVGSTPATRLADEELETVTACSVCHQTATA
jgi:hypothetical protein